MTQPRKRQIDLASTPFYHCICRCVRRAFLCGYDEYSGRDYEHRREWIVERIRLLASIFAIDVCAYAVMSNHVHLVLRVDKKRAKSWDNFELAKRWERLYGLPQAVSAALHGGANPAEKAIADQKLRKWRERLYSVSWFLKCLNEVIARRANIEDHCTGRFWEGRFKSQALLDERALLTCMAYVDLNPIRASMAKTPEDSDFTSIQERIKAWTEFKKIEDSLKDRAEEPWLLPFQRANEADQDPGPTIPFQMADYLELVEHSGRIIRPDKRGYIPPELPPILTRLGVNQTEYLEYVGSDDKRLVHGASEAIQRFATALKKTFFKNYRELGALYRLSG